MCVLVGPHMFPSPTIRRHLILFFNSHIQKTLFVNRFRYKINATSPKLRNSFHISREWSVWYQSSFDDLYTCYSIALRSIVMVDAVMIILLLVQRRCLVNVTLWRSSWIAKVHGRCFPWKTVDTIQYKLLHHIKVQTKWPKVCRRHYQIGFLERNSFYLD